MDQRDSCISSPALNELSKRLSDETDRLKYARVIYLSQSVGQRIDAIRKELQAPREYNKRQMRELVLDRNKCIHHSLMVTTSIGATKKRQHDKEASRRSTSYMPQLAHSINAFEHNTRCRCSTYIPPRCLGKRSTSIIDEVPPEQDVDESCDDTTESSRCSDEFIAEIQQRYSSYANIVHTTSFKYDLSGCPKEDKETGSGNMYENKEEMMEYQEEDAITISAVPTTPNQQAQEYNDFYAMVESLSNSGDPPSLASTLLSSYACKSLQDTKADDCTTLHEDQDCYLDIAEKHQHGDVEFSNNNDMPPTPPLSPAVAQGLCEPVKITPASKPSISIEHVHKKSRSGLRGIFKRTQYQVNDVLVSGRSLAGPLLDCLYSAKDLTANEPRVVLKLALTEVGSDTPNIMRRHGFNFEILHPGAKSKVGSPRLMASVKDTALVEAIQDWMQLVCRSYPQAARLSKAQRVLRDNKKIYVVFDKF